jgi:RNA polymerase sigma factor (sigma-70 family)
MALCLASIRGSRIAIATRRLDEFVRSHHRRAVAHANSVLRDSHLAEDAASDGYLQATAALHTYNTDLPIEPWILQIVYRAAIRLARRRMRQETLPLRDDVAQTAESDDIAEGILRHIEQAEEYRAGREAVRQLGPSEEWILLRDYAGMDRADIARQMRTTPDALKMQIHRAEKRAQELAAAAKENATGRPAWG